MSNEFKTTFIPKRKLTQTAVTKSTRFSSKGNSFIGLIATLLFITTLISSVGVYLYKMRVTSLVKEKVMSIQRAEKAFEPNVILDLKKLDIRLRAGNELLNKHIALSDFFESLGESTLPEVAFTDFSLHENHVEMEGESSSYLSIAQQSEWFEDNQYIQDPIFSDFELDEETGNVKFSLTFTLNEDLIHYGRTIKNKELNDVQERIQEQNVFIQEHRKTVQSGNDVDFNSLSDTQI